MNTIRSIVPMNSCRIPPRLKRVATRLGSLLLLFQRMPVVQFLFPEANIIGGASMANTISLAVTTVVGLGVFDSVAGQSTIDQTLPINKSTQKNVPAAVGSPLDFQFTWDVARDFSEAMSWKVSPTATIGTEVPAGLTMQYTLTTPFSSTPQTDPNYYGVNKITGIPTSPGTYPVTINVYRKINNVTTGSNAETVAVNFIIYVLGFQTHPATTTTINSGQTATLTSLATGVPATGAVLSYKWFEGISPSETTPAPGTNNSANYTTPVLSSSKNYWVKITSVLTTAGATVGATNTVSANSATAAVNVTTPPTVAVTPTGTLSKTSPINFTLTFSQSVTGLTIGGITVGNGTKGTLSGSGTTYTLPVTPTSQGAVTCQVNAGAAGGNTVSNTASVTYDSVAPTVAVTPTGTTTSSSPITFTLTFSESVTGLAVDGITVGNGTKGILSGSGTTYTLPVTPTAAGAVTCQVNAAAALDAATNANIVSNTASVNFTVTSPYDTWASGFSQNGPTEMPQGDGVTNLEKFAFNLNPRAPDVRRLTVGALPASELAGLPAGAKAGVGGVLRLEFLRRIAGTNPGITYTAQFGSDLAGWTDIDTGTPTGVAIDGIWERVTVDDLTGGTKRFGRVKVIKAP